MEGFKKTWNVTVAGRHFFFFFFIITLEPRVEWYNNLWALNTSPPQGVTGRSTTNASTRQSRDFRSFFMTLKPRVGWDKSLSLRALNTSPPRNRFTFLLSSCSFRSAAQRRCNYFKDLKDFYLKTTARIWPWQSYTCHIRHIRSTVACLYTPVEKLGLGSGW